MSAYERDVNTLIVHLTNIISASRAHDEVNLERLILEAKSWLEDLGLWDDAEDDA